MNVLPPKHTSTSPEDCGRFCHQGRPRIWRALLWPVLVADNGKLGVTILQHDCLCGSIDAVCSDTAVPIILSPFKRICPSSERNHLISILNIQNYFKVNATHILFLDSSQVLSFSARQGSEPLMKVNITADFLGILLFTWHSLSLFTCSGVHPTSYPMGTEGSFPGVKRPGREGDHSPPATAEVKKMWIYTFTTPYAFMA
jgi:hypothetical protein